MLKRPQFFRRKLLKPKAESEEATHPLNFKGEAGERTHIWRDTSSDLFFTTNFSGRMPQSHSPRREPTQLPKSFWSTERLNFEAAKTAILELYRLKGLREPEHILLADSPCAAMTAALCAGWLMESQPYAHRFYGTFPFDNINGVAVHDDNNVSATILHQCEQTVTVDFNSLASAYAGSLIAKTGTVLDESVQGELAAVFRAQLTQIREGKHISVTEIEGNHTVLLEHVTKATCTPLSALPYLTIYASDPEARKNPILTALMIIAENAGWWLAFNKAVIICDRPKLFNHDLEGRLHSTRQAAVEYRDGWKIYAYHGVVVPEHVIMQPEAIMIKDIQGEANIELRRILIDQYGLQRYLQDGNAKKISQDEYGELWQEPPAPPPTMLRDPGGTAFMLRTASSALIGRLDEPITMLRCRDKSSNREFWIRVPPTMETAHAAAAWTFNQTPEDYTPIKET